MAIYTWLFEAFISKSIRSTQGYLLTFLTVIMAAVRVMINQFGLAACGAPSSSTVNDSETNNDFCMLAVHKLIIKLITRSFVLKDAKSNRFPTLIFTQSIDHK